MGLKIACHIKEKIELEFNIKLSSFEEVMERTARTGLLCAVKTWGLHSFVIFQFGY